MYVFLSLFIYIICRLSVLLFLSDMSFQASFLSKCMTSSQHVSILIKSSIVYYSENSLHILGHSPLVIKKHIIQKGTFPMDPVMKPPPDFLQFTYTWKGSMAQHSHERLGWAHDPVSTHPTNLGVAYRQRHRSFHSLHGCYQPPRYLAAFSDKDNS